MTASSNQRAQVNIGPVAVGGGMPLALIAGPCVIENEEGTLRIAERLRVSAERLGVGFVFKASFDKANRTSITSYRGPGLEEGLRILARVKAEVGVPVISDIHLPEQAAPAAEVLDCLQIPAFLCRQTDILVAAGRTGKPVNIKKGQFLAPEDMENAVRKAEESGAGGVILTERGTTFGYRYLVVDFQGMARMAALGRPVVFDATHSVQTPGGGCGVSGGDRRYAPMLARAAAAVGIDALFVEVHPEPETALCDGPNSLALDEVELVVGEVAAIHELGRAES